MNSEYPAISSASPDNSAAGQLPPARKRISFTLWLLVLAFAGGILATLWAAPQLRQLWGGGSAEQAEPDNQSQALLTGEAEQSARAAQHSAALDVASLEARLAAVSAKLDAISEQAAGAGGNAARAEGLLIAFSARRALDRGSPLGYLEGELRLRFGDTQPRAVATIVNAANAPITIADLQQELDDASPKLLGTVVKNDWWTATKREIANLVVIRKASEPSPAPQKAIERAKLMISAGRVDAALKEIERLPNHQEVDDWLQQARQYNEARRALDVIEAAAILEPRTVPVNRTITGGTMQVAPPPPVVPTIDQPQE